MALKDLIGKLTGKPSRGPWQPAAGPFPRLMLLDAAAIDSLKDAGGLFALWHRGVRPQWIYVGYADDLADTLTAAQSDPDIELYNLNEGVLCPGRSVLLKNGPQRLSTLRRCWSRPSPLHP